MKVIIGLLLSITCSQVFAIDCDVDLVNGVCPSETYELTPEQESRAASFGDRFNLPPSEEASAASGSAGSEEIAGGACLQSAGVPALAACPATPAATIQISNPMNVNTCAQAFPEIWNNKSQFNSASLTGESLAHCKLIGDAQTRRTAAEQCAAIWYATANMTQFNNPRAGSSSNPRRSVASAESNEEAAEIRAENSARDRQERQAEAAVSVNGMNCVGRSEYDLDYPACKRFVAWYNGLQLAETGLTAYNQNQQIQANQTAQNQTVEGLRTGNQAAPLDGTATSLSANASSHDRVMLFNAARAGAIGAQLATFPNPRNLASKCSQSSPCCAVLGQMPGSESYYFPNAQMKAAMTAEIAKAVGAALAAKLAADAARKQKGIVNKIKDQITDGAVNNPGIINFCTQNPQDPRCLAAGGPGAVSPGSFGGNSFTAGDFGTDSLGNATTGDEFGALDNEGGLAGTDSIGGIGDIPADVKEAKEAFNAPSAGANIGSPTSGGAGGGAGAANASAPGLSKDPGAQGEQKPADTKVTSLGAAYNGAAYSGGAFRPGADRKPAAAENPFASLFGKDKAQDTSAVQIDAPASDLFVKISNRYSEVNKRKDLMEVK